MFHSLGVPIQIVKYVKKGIIFSEVPLTLHVWRANHQTTFHSPACTILITLVFVLQRSDIWLPRCPPGIAPGPCSACLQFLHILLRVFHVLKQWGKGLSCTQCHVLVMLSSDLALPHSTFLVRQLRRVKNQPSTRSGSGCRPPKLAPLHGSDGRTDGRTHCAQINLNLQLTVPYPDELSQYYKQRQISAQNLQYIIRNQHQFDVFTHNFIKTVAKFLRE